MYNTILKTYHATREVVPYIVLSTEFLSWARGFMMQLAEPGSGGDESDRLRSLAS